MYLQNTIRSNVSKMLRAFSPEYYWQRKIKYIRNNLREIEMNLLPILADKKKASIDIGAAIGSYLANLCIYSKNVIGFEPIPENISKLNEMIYYLDMNAEIEPYALSNKKGFTSLKMIKNDFGRSTIEPLNNLQDDNSNKMSIEVELKKLDDYNLQNIGFIKIDVEGHELSVLEGAETTIKNNRPNLLVEIEERHKYDSINSVKNWLCKFDYSGYFIKDRNIELISEFDINTYQNHKNIGDQNDNYKRTGIYINNFFFLPVESAENTISEARKHLQTINN